MATRKYTIIERREYMKHTAGEPAQRRVSIHVVRPADAGFNPAGMSMLFEDLTPEEAEALAMSTSVDVTITPSTTIV